MPLSNTLESLPAGGSVCFADEFTPSEGERCPPGADDTQDAGPSAECEAGREAEANEVKEPAAASPAMAPSSQNLQERLEMIYASKAGARREQNKPPSAAARPVPDLAVRLAEAGKSLVAIRQARDSLLARNHELIEKLARAENEIAELADQRDLALRERDEAVQRADGASPGAGESNGQCPLLPGTIPPVELVAPSPQDAGDQTADLPFQLGDDPPTVALVPPVDSGDQSSHSDGASGLPPQTAAHGLFSPEYESLQADFAEERMVLEAQLFALRQRFLGEGESASDEPTAPSLNAVESELHAVELHARLTASRAEVESLRQRLSDVLAIAAPLEAAPVAPESLDFALPLEADAPPIQPEASAIDDPLNTQKLRAGLEQLLIDPTKVEVLAELHADLDHLRGAAEAMGSAALAHYAGICAELVHGLRKYPAHLAASLPHLHEAVELLTALGDAAASAPPDAAAGATVYVVDADADNCECMAHALGKAGLHAQYAVRAESALQHLAAAPCDLIVLERDLDQWQGGNLAAQIRQLPHHAQTPMLFLGEARPLNETEQSSGVPVAWLEQPYHLDEFSFLAAGLILKSRLHR